jgi:formate dehydrogenase maturation protein FdhE
MMSYCPDCCSEEFDDIKRGNKRFFVCEICGAEWVEEEAGPKGCQDEKKLPIKAEYQMAEPDRRRRY